jgi:hypothetical protein
MTVFLGCGFAAKYREGGGNFSVPLQWMLGLRRLKLDAIWLEHLPGEGNSRDDQRKIENFQRQLRAHGLGGRYCLLYQKTPDSAHDLDAFRCIGISKRELLDRLAGPNALLNLSYSIHPPLLLKFERRIFCDLDPSQIIYWMTQMEMGQSSHHEFWTIGLNVNSADCRLPKSSLNWKTFYPLVDTKLYQPQPRPRAAKFTTIGQWYWGGAVEINGEFPDLSKKYAFEQYLDLPRRVPNAKFELAMFMNPDDPERERLRRRAMIDAGLGRKEQALEEGRRAIALAPLEKDVNTGSRVLQYFAITAAWTGEKELALQQLETGLRAPDASLVLSYGALKLLPFWDPLRGDPRFEKIVASLAPKQ